MYKIYQVEYGDTLDIIANKAGTTVENIKKINGFTGDNELVVGSLIIVPKENELLFEKYIVQQGDSIYSISRRYNVDPNLILEVNGLNKSDYIYPNQEILIPSKNFTLYVTKQGDTIDKIINDLNTNYDKLLNQNNKIFVVEDQLIAVKKELN